MTALGNDPRPRATLAAAAIVAAMAGLAVAGCGRSRVFSVEEAGTSRSGCAPGETPLVPRTLAQGAFTGIAWHDGAVVATWGDDVMSFPANGDPPTKLAHMDNVLGLVATRDQAFFSASGAKRQELFSVALAGGVPTLLPIEPVDLGDHATTDGVAVYAPGIGGGIVRVAEGSSTNLPLPVSVGSLAVYAGTVYVATSTSARSGSIVKLPATGGAMQTVVANIGAPWGLVADASGLYWVEFGPSDNERIARADLDGRNVKALVAHGANSLAVARGDLYIASAGISKVPIGGGAEVPLVTGLLASGGIIVADGNAAWLAFVAPVSPTSGPPMLSLMTTCL